MLAHDDPPGLIIRPGVREEEFYSFESEDSDWEFLDGRLVLSPSSDRHEDLFRFLLTLVSAFLDERGGGAVRGSRYPMRLDAQWSPEPDLLVVRDERRHLMTYQRLEGPADWVVEIASDWDPCFEIREKLPRYRQAAIPEIWLIDPFQKTLRVETRSAAGYDVRELQSGRIESQVLPGFWIDAAWLWAEPFPSTMACLRQILG